MKKIKRLMAMLMIFALTGGLLNIGSVGNGYNTIASAEDDYYYTGDVDDVSMSVASTPTGSYGQNMTIAFTVKSSKGLVYSVTPSISDSFPFETNGDAYKTVSSDKGTNSLVCSYTMKVRDDVETGYNSVAFDVRYVKSKVTYTVSKTINVKLTGKPEVTTTETATTTESTSDSDDVNISVENIPSGTYNQSLSLSFKAYSDVAYIKSVTPVIDTDFPFVTKGDAYKCVNATGSVKSLNCAYDFTVKSDITTGYHPVSFTIVYKKGNQTFTAVKTINIKFTGKKSATTTESVSQSDDINLSVGNVPSGKYGGALNLAFKVYSDTSKINSVTPVIDGDFPFVTKGDAYKCFSVKNGAKSINCNYNFTVKNDITTGYHTVSFTVIYTKGKQTLTTNRAISVYLEGKKESTTTEATTEGLVSTPRVMVTDYSTDVDSIHPGSQFTLTVSVKNTAGKNVKNVKVSMSTANGEFIPTSGSTNVFIDSMAADEVKQVTYNLTADTSLQNQPYAITFNSEYEDEKNNPFTGTDTLYVPVELEQRLSVTDIMTEDDVVAGDTAEVTGTVNNLSSGMLYNVTANIEGANIEPGSTYLGNVEAGKSVSFDLLVKTITSCEEGAPLTITISYEDSKGNVKEQTTKATMAITSTNFKNIEKLKTEDEGGLSGNAIAGIVVGIAILAIIVAALLKRRKRKKEILDEFK